MLEEDSRGARDATSNEVVVHPGFGLKVRYVDGRMVKRQPNEMLDTGFLGRVDEVFALLFFLVERRPD